KNWEVPQVFRPCQDRLVSTNPQLPSTSTSPTTQAQAQKSRRPKFATRGGLAGLAVCVVIAFVANILGEWTAIVGARVVGVVAGGIVTSIAGARRRQAWAPGLPVASKLGLQVAVVLLGAQLSLREVANVGWSSLPVMLGTLTAGLVGATLIGRALGINR